jgi:hypothetical protein
MEAPLPSPTSPPTRPDEAETRFDLTGEQSRLAMANRRLQLRAFLILGVFVAAGLLIGEAEIGHPTVWGRLFPALVLGLLGSPAVGVWYVRARRPAIAGLRVGPLGLVAVSGKGAERRYAWNDPQFRLLLWRQIQRGELDPAHEPSAHWHLRLDAPRVYGSVPQGCYERLLSEASARGLSVTERKLMHASKAGSYQTLETRVHPG